MIDRLHDLDETANIGNGLGLGDQLLRSFELADDRLGSVADTLRGEGPGRAWPDEDSHAPWTNVQGYLIRAEGSCVRSTVSHHTTTHWLTNNLVGHVARP